MFASPPIEYEPPVYRPPSEAQSLLVQVTVGCSHNKCTYCAMYRSKKFRVRGVDEIIEDLETAACYFRRHPRLTPRKLFLCDGDALVAPMTVLVPVLEKANELFPALRRVGTYVTADNVLQKTEEELKYLAQLKLTIGYLGLESGCDKVLKMLVKGNTCADMSHCLHKLRVCGWKSSVIAMLGVGGRKHTASHRTETARVISETSPDFFSFLTTVPIPNTPYFTMLERGQLEQLTTKELLEEMRDILAGMKTERGIIFRANHVSNQYPLGGVLPKDKPQLLATLKTWIHECPKGIYPDYQGQRL